MEHEPLSSENEALWMQLWDLWQANDEEDVILDSSKLEDIEDAIPALQGRTKTALAYLQRARYIQYRSGVGDDGIEPILYDVYEPR
jgi:hypothetical protein